MRLRSSLTVVCGMIAAASAWAQSSTTIQFRWASDYNILTNRFDEYLGVNGATVLTFVSTDTIVNAWNAVTGNTMMLENAYADDQFFMAKGNSIFEDAYDTHYMSESPTDHAGKYVYAIILDYPYANFEALGSTDAQRLANVPRDGSVYAGISTISHVGVVVTPLQNLAPPGPGLPPWPPQSFRGYEVSTIYQVIPEPSTTVLLLGAAAVIGLRWRMRRR